MNSFYQIKRVFAAIFVTLLVLSCSNSDTVERISFNMPQEATHELNEVFKLTGPEEGDFFNNFMNVDFLGNGNLIVLEMNATRFFEFSPDGELLQVVGRRGRGPGEFTHIWNFVLTPDDSLHVYEMNSGRQHVFYKTGEEWLPVRETVSVPNLYDRSFVYDIPRKIFHNEGEGYYAQFGSTVTPHDTTTKHYNFLMETDVDLRSTGDFKFLYPVVSTAVYRSDGFSTGDYHRDFRRSFFHYLTDIGKVILTHNDSNKIELLSEHDEPVTIGHLPYEQFPLDMEKNREWLGLISNYSDDRLKLIHSKFLPHEPFYHNVLLDGDTFWIELNRQDKELPNWIITTLEGEILKVFHGPEDLKRAVVREDRLYGVYHGYANEPALAGYELTAIE